MVIVKLTGGLGNQMFQYAHARTVAIREKTDLLLDITFYIGGRVGMDTPRGYSLHRFNIIEKFATEDDLKKVVHADNLIAKVLRRLKILLYPQCKHRIYDQIHKNSEGNFYIEGTWQDEKYFTEQRDDIIKEFSLRNSLGSKAAEKKGMISSCKNSVSLHIRRGDYTNRKNSKILGVQPIEYYNKAISIIKDKANDSELFVFSDDIDWARENLKTDLPINFVSDKDMADYEELILMSKCKNHIIANSSFSWWGAWLNPNKDKVVIAPKEWFKGEPSSYNSIVPNSWIKI